jgi:Cu(I)/Ag(I) efflux system membrane fusion protein
MKKVIIPVVLLIAVVLGIYIVVYKNKESKNKHDNPAPISVNSGDSLTGSTGLALKAYFDMKDAFVKSDTGLVNRNAGIFVTSLGALKADDIKADKAIVDLTTQLKDNLIAETNTLISAKDIESKRKHFQVVSDGMFDLLRTIGYRGSKVYQQYCPMAFNNSGAAWLSNTTEIFNPYFGDKMLHCGDVRDSVSVK